MRKILIHIIIFAVIGIAQQGNLQNRYLMGKSFQQSGDLEKAKSIFTEVYQSQPGNFEYFKSLNEVYLLLKEYQSSINLIEEKLKSQPQNLDLYGMLGSTYYLMGKEEKAFKVWDEALEKLPPNQFNYKYLANVAIERRAFEKAIDILKRGKEMANDPRLFSLDLAHLYSITMNFEQAAREYCDMLETNAGSYNLIESRIMSYIGKPGALEKSIEVFEDCGSDNDYGAKKILSKLYLENQSYEKAFEVYRQLEDLDPNNTPGSELMHFGRAALSADKYEIASEAYNEIINEHSNSPLVPAAKLGLANTLEAKFKAEVKSNLNTWKPYYQNIKIEIEKLDEVVSNYKAVIDEYPNTQVDEEALFKIGELKYKYENDLNEAQEYFKKIIERGSSFGFLPKALLNLGEIAILKDNLSEAADHFSLVIKDRRSSIEQKNEADFKLSRVLFYQNDFKKAKELLDNLIQNLQDDNANDAIEFSLILNTKLNDSTTLVTFSEAELFAVQKNYEDAASRYELIASNKHLFVLSKIAEFKLAEMELALNNYETSIDILSKIAGEEEKNIYADKALYLLGKIYQFGIKNDEKAIEVYEKLLAKFPDSLYLDDARKKIINLKNKLS